MKQMEEYKSMLARLNTLLTALENGELSIDELVELEEVTRKLHERSIILRYNAFKNMVQPQEEEGPEVEEEEPEKEMVTEPEPQEEQAFDFSIFSEPEEETKEEVKEEIPEPVIELEKEPEVEETIAPEPEPIVESVSEPTPEPVVESNPEPEEKEEEPTSVSPTGSSFLDKLVIEDTSLGNRFAAQKLDSLIGAFGLNERLRFINDLFEGSSELFSDAIKSLDSQSDLDTARNTAASFAVQYEWDPEEEVVVEFMTYVSRRYA